jgi:hypothetical protein
MALTRTIWKNKFTIDNFPSWICPSCAKGILVGDKKSIKTVESFSSIEARNHDDWDPEWVSGSFGGTLKCNNSNCEEPILIIGKMDVVGEQEYDEQFGDWNFTYSEFLFPIAFVPTLHIFSIHSDVPDEIRKAVIDSFKVYWIDISSCGNKIRKVIELVMDEQKVSKTFIDRGKRKGYTLHKRIEIFKVTKTEEADLLMAIKWIGNSGSHTNEELTKDDILDAYEILEHVITKLYEKDSNRLKKLSKTINKKRKPIGHKRAVKKK